jgi:hypothetical protein
MLQSWEISRFADGIEDGITDELLSLGVAETNILLAFHRPDVRLPPVGQRPTNTGDAIG